MLNLAEPKVVANTRVVDDIYADPDTVRTMALGGCFQYRLDTVTYPGSECFVASARWPEIWSALRGRYLPEAKDRHSSKAHGFKQGKFRLATERDQAFRPDGVHQDVQRWTGVIYLTPDCYCEEGTGYYQHIASGALSQFDPAYPTFVTERTVGLSRYEAYVWQRAHQRDLSNWRLVGEIPMRFNRLVLVDGHRFHGTMKPFGHGLSTGRLTQHFEFY